MSERTIQDLKHLAALEPDSAEAHFHLGTALLHGGQVAEAVVALRTAAKLAPESSSAYLNLGVALLRLRRIEEAESVQRRFVELNPDHAEMHTNLAYTLLLRGHFQEGWREHEWRWRQVARLAERRPFGVPRWEGSPAPRQTLLLHAEQGFGDTIQFLRYVPLVGRVFRRAASDF